MDSDNAASQILRAAKLLYDRGLVNAYEGNVSERVGDCLLITPSQVCKGDITKDDLVMVSITTGETLSAKNGRKASSEVKMHLCCYRARPDISAVCHAHPPYATAFAVAGLPIETAAYPEMLVLFDRVPICAYGTPGTDDVNRDIPETLKSHDHFLLGNHGLVAVGSNAMDATYKLESLESIARVMMLARGLGGESPLSDSERITLKRQYESRRGRM